jgi:hypothetical protein
MITGTPPAAFAGVLSVAWISTLIAGYAELSTLPRSCLVTTGISPMVLLAVLTTDHATLGVFGVRP